MKIQEEAKAIAKKVEEFRSGLLNLIQTLPGNPAAHGDDKCFTMNISSLDQNFNLSPEHYNFKRQYQKVATILNRTPIESIDDTFKSIFADSKFHPQVIENIKTIWRP